MQRRSGLAMAERQNGLSRLRTLVTGRPLAAAGPGNPQLIISSARPSPSSGAAPALLAGIDFIERRQIGGVAGKRPEHSAHFVDGRGHRVKIAHLRPHLRSARNTVRR
jgi:hypothetical protein